VIAISPADFSAEEALCSLMGAYEPSLQRFAQSLLQDADLARDCVQDTFLRAYECLGRGRTINKNWLFTVARSRAMDEFRRRRTHALRLRMLLPPAIDAGETRVAVEQTMETLTPQHREVLYLFAVAGYTSDEIAGQLGITGPAVRQRLYRARRQFRCEYQIVNGGICPPRHRKARRSH
jgi:RNA polymerase sigma-70 factor (ECF subfamily)